MQRKALLEQNYSNSRQLAITGYRTFMFSNVKLHLQILKNYKSIKLLFAVT